MDLRDRIDYLESKGLVHKAKYERVELFVEALKAYDGKKAVIDEELRLGGNFVVNRVVLHDLLKDPRRTMSEALRNPRDLPSPESMSSYGYRRISPEELNVPQFFPRDAGKYFTASIVIARDPKGNLNASYHRILFKGSYGIMRVVPRHLYDIINARRTYGEDHLEAVIVIGVHPIVALASASTPPYGVYELTVANALAHKLFHKEITVVDAWGFPVPLAEIIMRVRIHVEPSEPEGPFLDILRLYDKPRPGYRVDFLDVYVRPDYILHALLPGGEEHRILMGFPRECSIYETVSRVVPVKAVYLTPGGGSRLHAVISIKKRREGDGKNAILAAFTGHPSLKHVVVVDEDIDVYDSNQVERSIATRFRADRDLVIIPGASGSTLDPSSDGTIAKMGLDATIKGNKERFIGERR